MNPNQASRPDVTFRHRVGEALAATGTVALALAGTVGIEAYVGALNARDKVRQVGEHVSSLHLVERFFHPAA